MQDKPTLANPRIVDVSIDRAYQIAAELTNRSEHQTSSMLVYSGTHSEFGAIHVVIPPLGDASLLPVVLQNFDV